MNHKDLLMSSSSTSSSNSNANESGDNYSVFILPNSNTSTTNQASIPPLMYVDLFIFNLCLNSNKDTYRTCLSSIHTHETSQNDEIADDAPAMSRACNSSTLNQMQINAMASYFNSNFDDNPYVFDGVKVEVCTCYAQHGRLSYSTI
jgi:hypothetical protein